MLAAKASSIHNDGSRHQCGEISRDKIMRRMLPDFRWEAQAQRVVGSLG